MDIAQLEGFATQARTFCHWATGVDGTSMNVGVALRRVSNLYAAALTLPQPFTEGMSEELVDVELPPGSVDLVAARAAELPMQIYWEIFDPIENPVQEPVAGSIVDDLSGIYSDVARGLVLFDSGQEAEALWEWAFNFRIHWGEHATGAMRALHAYLAQECPDGLSGDV